jgi:hypothetical protein
MRCFLIANVETAIAVRHGNPLQFILFNGSPVLPIEFRRFGRWIAIAAGLLKLACEITAIATLISSIYNTRRKIHKKIRFMDNCLFFGHGQI